MSDNLLNFVMKQGLLSKYDDSLRKVLEELYPEETWIDMESSKSKQQHYIQRTLASLFGDESIWKNFRDVRLLSDQ